MNYTTQTGEKVEFVDTEEETAYIMEIETITGSKYSTSIKTKKALANFAQDIFIHEYAILREGERIIPITQIVSIGFKQEPPKEDPR